MNNKSIETTLPNLSLDTIINIIENSLFNYNVISNNLNLVAEMNRINEGNLWGNDLEETNIIILKLLLSKLGFDIEIGMINNVSELCEITETIYDISISNIYQTISNFLINYIINNKSSIYNALELNNIRKVKNIDTIYSNYLIADNELSIIIANVENVSKFILDVDFDTIQLLITAGYNPDKVNLLSNYINSNFLIYHYREYLNKNEIAKVNILNDIKTYFYNIDKVQFEGRN